MKNIRTDWTEIAERVAKKLNIPVKDVIEEITTYSATLKKAISNKENVDYDFYLIGKMQPSSRLMKRHMRIYNKKVLKLPQIATKKEYVDFLRFFAKWEEVMKVGRWKIKGQFNPFKDNN